MKEVWDEIVQGIGAKALLVTLLSIIICFLLALALVRYISARDTTKLQLESNINHLFINPLQTNFTS